MILRSMKGYLYLFFVLFCINACIVNKNDLYREDKILTIQLYAIPLGAYTRIPVDTSSIQFDDYILSVRPGFYKNMYKIISAKKSSNESFRYSYVRMCYKIKYKDGSIENIFIDRGGKHLLYKNNVYIVDKRIAKIIVKYLPDSLSEINKSDSFIYSKNDYVPYVIRLHNYMQ